MKSTSFFVSIKAEAEKEFIAHINNLDFISWAGTHLGRWSMGMAIYGKDTDEVESRFQQLFSNFKEYITSHEFQFYKTTQFFTEKYFGEEKRYQASKIDEAHTPDRYDKRILKNLSKNSRISSLELSKKVPLTPVAISRRIRKLEKSRYIKGYSIYINVFRLNIYLFIFFIQNKRLEQRKKLFTYLQSHPKVSLLLDYIGDPFIEFGIFVKDPYEAREALQEIKETFPDNEIVDFFLTQEDFISFGAPDCVFE